MSRPLAVQVAPASRSYPDAIDTRLVLRIYAWLASIAGLAAYAFPPAWVARLPVIDGAPWSAFALFRAEAAVVVCAGLCAGALATIGDPIDRQRALIRFAIAHLVFGSLRFLQWHAVLSAALPEVSIALPVFLGGCAPLVVGSVLLYIGLTAATTTPMRTLVTRGLLTGGDGDVVDKASAPNGSLRSQYAEQIRRAARQEERARLARDLHDAVKQQLFVIQTAAATVQARFDNDPDGARQAADQIRTAAREAVVEMQALIEQLQAAPLENVGLLEALKKQCEALGFRTGATIDLAIGELPPSDAILPGAHEAIFRTAQEALANIGRHARATRVDVGLRIVGERLELSVSDDGAGFDPRMTTRGMGMGNMAARAREVGASFTVRSSPGTGTSISFSVPYSLPSARSHGLRALGWTAFLVVIGITWRQYDPISLIVAGITTVMAARHAAAFVRILSRRTA